MGARAPLGASAKVLMVITSFPVAGEGGGVGEGGGGGAARHYESYVALLASAAIGLSKVDVLISPRLP